MKVLRFRQDLPGGLWHKKLIERTFHICRGSICTGGLDSQMCSLKIQNEALSRNTSVGKTRLKIFLVGLPLYEADNLEIFESHKCYVLLSSEFNLKSQSSNFILRKW